MFFIDRVFNCCFYNPAHKYNVGGVERVHVYELVLLTMILVVISNLQFCKEDGVSGLTLPAGNFIALLIA